jgi:hypothetical protein
VQDVGRVLIYEGHDAPRKKGESDPKSVDQPRATLRGKLTENGLFEQAAKLAKNGQGPPEIVAVYEKIHAGIWAFNCFFRLTDSWQQQDDVRTVFKYRLELAADLDVEAAPAESLPHTRLIPSEVKLEVCSATKGNVSFAEWLTICISALPYSKGGTSLTAKNIRLLCATQSI